MENINLTRSWRCRTFDQMIGQTVSIRILKNSLYRNYFVPIYLFAGLKGSGKTTLARIFAAALNCDLLTNFQQDPKKYSLPCLSCTSCVQAAKGSHPDILEIDAASHTGVDHVRTIIDAVAHLPVLGRKRVYIIDEAHMLSKAAFNAFLKILEEPPAGVLFIMATTELSKILETVRSRSLHLFFNPIERDLIVGHLKRVCDEEKIAYELDGLKRIAHESNGSARDALNMLERVRLANPTVILESVTEGLGLCSESLTFELLSAVIQKKDADVVALLKNYEQEPQRAISLWRHIGELLSTLLTELCTQQPVVLESLNLSAAIIFRPTECMRLLQIWLEYDQILIKGVSPYCVIQLALITMASSVERNSSTNLKAVAASDNKPVAKVQETIQVTQKIPEKSSQSQKPSESTTGPADTEWHGFLRKIEGLNDPLLNSIFNQVRKKIVDTVAGAIQLHFSQDLSFFKDWLQTTQQTWQPLLNKAYEVQLVASFHFDQPVSVITQHVQAAQQAPTFIQPVTKANPPIAQRQTASPQYEVKKKMVMRKQSYGPILHISDKNEWPRASALNEIFPGTIYIESSV